MAARFSRAYGHPTPPSDEAAKVEYRPVGSALLVVDTLHRDYLCRWYDGPEGDVLRERARAPSAIAAVRWATARTDRIRIEAEDGLTYWAGTGPVPAGVEGRWTEENR